MRMVMGVAEGERISRSNLITVADASSAPCACFGCFATRLGRNGFRRRENREHVQLQRQTLDKQTEITPGTVAPISAVEGDFYPVRELGIVCDAICEIAAYWRENTEVEYGSEEVARD
jgi:hypothetical protein